MATAMNCGTVGQSDDGQAVCRQWMWTNAGGRTVRTDEARETPEADVLAALRVRRFCMSWNRSETSKVEGRRRDGGAKRRRPRGGTWSAGLRLCSATPMLGPWPRVTIASLGRRPERERAAAAEGTPLSPGRGPRTAVDSPPEGPESTAEGSAVFNRRRARRKRRHGQSELPKFRATCRLICPPGPTG
ncbi:hypothetical protein THAOC_23940 [Thalassiosira oceanica]|uniref:Uncharacterized protein n=1 Tax=Thalassiosira oceanica TaxID=159749 RepID=K0SC18_THAOC|nr:hypothetical protein THAOC_23940 [Thalassiosira oceanica]|eukprot:EJK56217.1 hypothetical protein THAOC_23940 [Thalassiosira oceanica]